jgi:hypothetical protein
MTAITSLHGAGGAAPSLHLCTVKGTSCETSYRSPVVRRLMSRVRRAGVTAGLSERGRGGVAGPKGGVAGATSSASAVILAPIPRLALTMRPDGVS